MENFELAGYLTNGAEKILKNILRATLRGSRERLEYGPEKEVLYGPSMTETKQFLKFYGI